VQSYRQSGESLLGRLYYSKANNFSFLQSAHAKRNLLLLTFLKIGFLIQRKKAELPITHYTTGDFLSYFTTIQFGSRKYKASYDAFPVYKISTNILK